MENSKRVDGVRVSEKGGAFIADNMDEVVKVVSDDSLLQRLKTGAVDRAKREMVKINVGRENLVNTVLGDAMNAMHKQRLRGLARAFGGAGLLGLGGASLINALSG